MWKSNVLFILGLVVLILVFGCYNAHAQEVTVMTALRPIYLGADGAIFADKVVSQSDLSMSWKSGWFADIWGSTGGDTRPEFDKELDLIGGWAGKCGRLKCGSNFQYYFIQGVDVVNGNVEVGYGPFYVRLEAYAPTQSHGPHHGLLPNAGFSISGVPLFERYQRVKIDAAQWVKYDTGAFGFGEAWLLQGHAATTIELCKKLGVGAGLRWSVPITEIEKADGRKGETAWEVFLTRRLN